MIKILCVGKIKESFFRDAVDEYVKRITKYTQIEIISVQDEGLLDEKTTIKKETEKIEKLINYKDYIVVLDINGKNFDSVELANKIDQIFNNYSNITFVIGGSYGLSESFKEKANLRLSFSKLTFPHQLFRIMLLEQIYRCYRINNNESYHK